MPPRVPDFEKVTKAVGDVYKLLDTFKMTYFEIDMTLSLLATQCDTSKYNYIFDREFEKMKAGEMIERLKQEGPGGMPGVG